MFENDIKLDHNGSSVIENGDFVLTDSDKEFIMLMLITTPNSWKYDAFLGVGLEEFIGKKNNENVYLEMKRKIKDFFKRYAIVPDIIIYKINEFVAGLNILFYYLNGKELNISFQFNFENGNIKFFSAEDFVESKVVTNSVNNKYLRMLK